jgi:Rrf2 family protein
MLMLSKKVEYGLIAVLHMASLPGGELATAKEISDHYGIPGDLLGKVLQALSRDGIVEAVHGAKGGYRLERSLDTMNLGQVIEAVEGPVFIARCQEDPANCGQFHTCNIKEPVTQINEQLQNYIHGISLAAFRKPAVPTTAVSSSTGVT